MDLRKSINWPFLTHLVCLEPWVKLFRVGLLVIWWKWLESWWKRERQSSKIACVHVDCRLWRRKLAWYIEIILHHSPSGPREHKNHINITKKISTEHQCHQNHLILTNSHPPHNHHHHRPNQQTHRNNVWRVKVDDALDVGSCLVQRRMQKETGLKMKWLHSIFHVTLYYVIFCRRNLI